MFALMLVLFACTGEDPAEDPAEDRVGDTSAPRPLDERVAAFRSLAAADGWHVQEGVFRFFDGEGCCDPDARCGHNNPGTPYGLYELPPGPGQTGLDVSILEAAAPVFHMRPDEAIVLLGPTPPRSAYFSLRSYLWIRYEDGEPVLIGASLGASLNHRVMAEQLGTDDVWGRPMAVVTSAEGTVEARVHGLLESAGFARAEIFDDRMTHEPVRWGLHDGADLLSFLLRTALIEDPAAAEAWYADPGLTLLRLTPKDPRPVTRPHPYPELPKRGTGVTEKPWRDALDALEAAVRDHYAPLVAARRLARPTLKVPVHCISQGRCAAEIHDRHYGSVEPFTLPDEDTFAVVLGVNHTRTGKASYSNVAIHTVEHALGLTSVEDPDLVGTARGFLPDHPQVDDLYAWVLARDCTPHVGLPCTEVPTGCPGVELADGLFLGFRAYLEPATGAGPLPWELLPERVLRFAHPIAP